MQRCIRPVSVIRLSLAALALLATLVPGCTVYAPADPSHAVGPPSTTTAFERSWAAAVGAFGDEGVRVTNQDRDAGLVSGSREGIDIVARVRSRADGSVRVEFNTSGATGRDPGLIERISRAYDRRMGR